jgi:hypothetical protein
MNNENDIIDEYLKLTGQTFQELMSGAHAFGTSFVTNLAKQAIEENKKIIWEDEPGKIDAMSFTLEDL